MHDHIILLTGKIWFRKTSLAMPFYLLKRLYQGRKVSGHVFVC